MFEDFRSRELTAEQDGGAVNEDGTRFSTLKDYSSPTLNKREAVAKAADIKKALLATKIPETIEELQKQNPDLSQKEFQQWKDLRTQQIAAEQEIRDLNYNPMSAGDIISDTIKSVAGKGPIQLGRGLYETVNQMSKSLLSRQGIIDLPAALASIDPEAAKKEQYTPVKSLDEGLRRIGDAIGIGDSLAPKFGVATQAINATMSEQALASQRQVDLEKQLWDNGSRERQQQATVAGENSIITGAKEIAGGAIAAMSAYAGEPLAAADIALSSMLQYLAAGGISKAATTGINMTTPIGKKLADSVARVAGTLYTGASEGGSNASQVREEFYAMPEAEFDKIAGFADRAKTIGRDAAKAEIAEDMASTTYAIAFTLGAVANKVSHADKVEAGLFVRNAAAKTTLKGTMADWVAEVTNGIVSYAGKVGSEAAEELMQGSTGALAGNVAKRVYADPNQSLIQDMGWEAGAGAIAGALSVPIGSVASGSYAIAQAAPSPKQVAELLKAGKDSVKATVAENRIDAPKPVNMTKKMAQFADKTEADIKPETTPTDALAILLAEKNVPKTPDELKGHVAKLNDKYRSLFAAVSEKMEAHNAKAYPNAKEREKGEAEIDALQDELGYFNEKIKGIRAASTIAPGATEVAAPAAQVTKDEAATAIRAADASSDALEDVFKKTLYADFQQHDETLPVESLAPGSEGASRLKTTVEKLAIALSAKNLSPAQIEALTARKKMYDEFLNYGQSHTKKAGEVAKDILSGGRGFLGATQYVEGVMQAVKTPTETSMKEARSLLTGLQGFANNQRIKADRQFKQAETFKDQPGAYKRELAFAKRIDNEAKLLESTLGHLSIEYKRGFNEAFNIAGPTEEQINKINTEQKAIEDAAQAEKVAALGKAKKIGIDNIVNLANRRDELISEFTDPKKSDKIRSEIYGQQAAELESVNAKLAAQQAKYGSDPDIKAAVAEARKGKAELADFTMPESVAKELDTAAKQYNAATNAGRKLTIEGQMAKRGLTVQFNKLIKPPVKASGKPEVVDSTVTPTPTGKVPVGAQPPYRQSLKGATPVRITNIANSYLNKAKDKAAQDQVLATLDDESQKIVIARAEEISKGTAGKPTTTKPNQVAVDKSQLSQNEYADHLVQNGLPEGVTAYDELTTRSDLRGLSAQQRVDLFNQNRTDVTGFRNRVESLWQTLRGKTDGVRSIGADSSWTNFEVGSDSHKSGSKRHKSYATINDFIRISQDDLRGFLHAMRDAGYNGQVKVPGIGARALLGFDNIVMHGATEADAKLGQQVAKDYFGNRLTGTQVGIDSAGQSHTQILADNVDQQIKQKGKPTTTDKAPVKDIATAIRKNPKGIPQRLVEKDAKKAESATQFIGTGSPKSSTAIYAKLFDKFANTGNYKPEDKVFVSLNGGNSSDRVSIKKPNGKAVLELLKKAVAAGSTIIADNATNRSNGYNTGELELVEFLSSKEVGYAETNGDGVWKPVKAVDKPAKPTTSNPKVRLFKGFWTVADVKADLDSTYVFGDNFIRRGEKGQAVIRNLPNAFGLVTKIYPDTTDKSYFDDSREDHLEGLNGDIDGLIDLYAEGKSLVFPEKGLGTGLSEMPKRAPKLYQHLQYRIQEELGNPYGTSIKETPFPARSVRLNVKDKGGREGLLGPKAERSFKHTDGKTYTSTAQAYDALKTDNSESNTQLLGNLLYEFFEKDQLALRALLDTKEAELTYTQGEGIWQTEYPALLMDMRNYFQEWAELENGTYKVKPPVAGPVGKLSDAEVIATAEKVLKLIEANDFEGAKAVRQELLKTGDYAKVNAALHKLNPRYGSAQDIPPEVLYTGATANKVLEWVEQNSESNHYKMIAKLLKDKIAPEVKIRVFPVTGYLYASLGAAGLHFPVQNRIEILGPSIEIFLHEGLHSALNRAVPWDQRNDPLGAYEAQNDLLRNLEKLKKHLKATVTLENGYTKEELEQLKPILSEKASIEEMVTYGLTRYSIQQLFDKVPAPAGSKTATVLSEFFRYIADFFKVNTKDRTVLAELLSITEDLFGLTAKQIAEETNEEDQLEEFMDGFQSNEPNLDDMPPYEDIPFDETQEAAATTTQIALSTANRIVALKTKIGFDQLTEAQQTEVTSLEEPGQQLKLLTAMAQEMGKEKAPVSIDEVKFESVEKVLKGILDNSVRNEAGDSAFAALFSMTPSNNNILHGLKDFFTNQDTYNKLYSQLSESQKYSLDMLKQFHDKMFPIVKSLMGVSDKDGLEYQDKNPVEYLYNQVVTRTQNNPKVQNVNRMVHKDDLADPRNKFIEDNIVSAIVLAAYNWVGQESANTIKNYEDNVKGILGYDSDDSLPWGAYQAFTEEGTPSTSLKEGMGNGVMKILGIREKSSTPEGVYSRLPMAFGFYVHQALINAKMIEINKIPTQTVNQFAKNASRIAEQPAAVQEGGNVEIEGENQSQLISEEGGRGDVVNERSYVSFTRVLTHSYEKEGENFIEAIPEVQQYIDATKVSRNLLSEFFGASEYTTPPSLQPLEPMVNKIKGSSMLMPEEILLGGNRMQEAEWTLDDSRLQVWDLLSKATQEAAAGILTDEEIAAQHISKRDNLEANNNGKRREIEQLKEFIAELRGTKKGIKTPFWLKAFATKAGRLDYATNINPVSSKVHRWFMNMKDWSVTIPAKGKEKYDFSTQNMRNAFLLAVGASFGVKVDLSQAAKVEETLALIADPVITEAVEAVRQLQMHGRDVSNKAELEQKILKAMKKGGEKLHTFAALEALTRYHPTKAFTTNLFLEVDGKTNGPAITLFQYLGWSDPADFMAMANKVGIYFDETETYGQWKDTPGTFDSYQQFAVWVEDAFSTLNDLYTQTTEMHPVLLSIVNDYTDAVLGKEDAFIALQSLIGPLTETKDGVTKVSSAMRLLHKPPVMTQPYGIGMDTMAANYSENFIGLLYDQMMKIDAEPETAGNPEEGIEAVTAETKKAKIEATLAAIAAVIGKTVDQLVGYDENTTNNIKDFQFSQKVPEGSPKDTLSDYDAVHTFLGHTYGAALRTVFFQRYEEMRTSRQEMNNMISIVYAAYERMYRYYEEKMLNEKVQAITSKMTPDEAKEAHPRLLKSMSLTFAEIQQLKDSLLPVAPLFKGPFSSKDPNNHSDSVMVLKQDDSFRVWNNLHNAHAYRAEVSYNDAKFPNGVVKYSKQYGSKDAFSPPGVSAGPIGVQHIDGAIQAEMQARYWALNVKDAVGLSLKDAYVAPPDMNRFFLGHMSDYNMKQAVHDTLKRVASILQNEPKEIQDHVRTTIVNAEILDGYDDKNARVNFTNINDMVTVLGRTVANEKRVRDAFISQITHVSQYPLGDTHYAVPDKVTTEEQAATVVAELIQEQVQKLNPAIDPEATVNSSIALPELSDLNTRTDFDAALKFIPQGVGRTSLGIALLAGNLTNARTIYTRIKEAFDLAKNNPYRTLNEEQLFKITAMFGEDYYTRPSTFQETRTYEEDGSDIIDFDAKPEKRVLVTSADIEGKVAALVKIQKYAKKGAQIRAALKLLASDPALTNVTNKDTRQFIADIQADLAQIEDTAPPWEDPITFGSTSNSNLNRTDFNGKPGTALNSSNVVGIFEGLTTVGPKRDSTDHLKHLLKVVSKIGTKIVGPYVMHKQIKGARTIGETDMDAMYMNIGNQIISQLDLSAAEVYSHELVHKAIAYALDNNAGLRIQAEKLFDQVKAELKRRAAAQGIEPHMMLAPQNATTADVSAALQMYNYIFENSTQTAEIKPVLGTNKVTRQFGNSYLHEFMAYGLTNETLGNLLKSMDADSLVTPKPTNFVQRMIALYDKVVNWITEKMLRGDAFKTGTAADRLYALGEALSQTNTQAAGKLQKFYDGSNKLLLKGLDSYVRAPLVAFARSRYMQNNTLLANSSYRPVAAVGRLLVATGTLVDTAASFGADQFRLATEKTLKRMGQTEEGFIMHTMAEILPSTTPAKIWEGLHRYSLNAIDQLRKQVSSGLTKQLIDVYADVPGRPEKVTQAEKTGVTAMVIRADIGALLSDTLETRLGFSYTLPKVRDLISNTRTLQREIQAIERLLKSAEYGVNGNHYIRQARSLGHMQAQDEAIEEHTQSNAHDIAQLYALEDLSAQGVQHIQKRGDLAKAESLIDVLATLYAIEFTNYDVKKDFLAVYDRETPRGVDSGLNFTIHAHEMFKKKSAEQLFENNKAHIRKGYIRETYDPYIEFKIASGADKDILFNRGFVQQSRVRFDLNDPVGGADMWLYTNDTGRPNRIKGVTSLTAEVGKGADLVRVRSQQNDPQAFMSAGIDLMRLKATKLPKVLDQFTTDVAATIDPDHNMLVPIIATNGEISTYRYMMSRDKKVAYLKLQDPFDVVMGNMLGSITDKVNTKTVNKEIVKLAFQDYQQNYLGNSADFTAISLNSLRPKDRELYYLMPQDMRKEIRRTFGADAIYIRTSMLKTVFGYKQWSVTDLRDKAGGLGTTYRTLLKLFGVVSLNKVNDHNIRKIENLWQEVIGLAKDSIVVKSVDILAGNIMSNTMLLWAKGVPFADIIKHSHTAIVGSRTYNKDKQELDNLKREYSYDPTRKHLPAQMAKIAERMARNPVAELINAGVYQSIMEDVEAFNLPETYATPLEKLVSPVTGKLGSKINPKVKRAGEIFLLKHDTQAYQILRDVTQLSDFTARYVLHQHNLNVKKMSREDSVHNIVKTFINYDIPTHEGLDYANRMGLAMFTKYFLRVQQIAVALAFENPSRVLVLALGQLLFGPVSNIMNSSVLEQGMLSHFQNPLGVPFGSSEMISLELVKDALKAIF